MSRKFDAALAADAEVATTGYCPPVRCPLAASLGPVVQGIAPIYCDPNDPAGMEQGATQRFAREVPKIEKGMLRRLRNFTRKFVRRHFEPLEPGSIPTFEEWLDSTPYSEARKAELVAAHEDMPEVFRKKDLRVKSFAKLESYPSHKAMRWINSRGDKFKCFAGPIIKAIEEKVYDLGQDGSYPFRFIKHVPVPERATYLRELFDSTDAPSCFVETDHTAFEAHVVPEIMESIQMQVYSYFLKHYPKEYSQLRRALTGRNLCKSKYVRVLVNARRMSGEMDTSLGNGLINLIIFLFLCEVYGVRPLAGVVEGDDGLFSIQGAPFTVEQARVAGMELKMETFADFSDASFCGLCFDRASDVIIRDPAKVIGKIGWTHSDLKLSRRKEVREGLLKAKALSLACEVSGCPVLSVLAASIVNSLADVKAIWSKNDWGGEYWMQHVLHTLGMQHGEGVLHDKFAREIPMSARRLVRRKFGWTISEQLEVEHYLRKHDMRQPIDNPLIREKIALAYPDWVDNWSNYVIFWPAGSCWHDLNLSS